MKREWLIKLREEKGLKQFEIAKTLDISSNYYCEIEKGKKNPRWNIAMRIAKFFDVSVDNFFYNPTRVSRVKGEVEAKENEPITSIATSSK
ncbi:transcriptional regulator [Bacillus toyonensis]|uniref:helix-turn-helix transcriptional regulator n=1 Tax=Bacillus toyonensis TaxID=155322 RepID=UPI000BF0FA8F|nr:helix-turn-helix transcriptional regulator [Bacillus toyonensis]PEO57812.1 transcriptional regulator [Bacillus toyonensis]PFX68233.1 transcriptional regulator [Bacillus toyonensis]PFX79895.1 transcriptional regulator [Bacillus toyonensis]PGB06043.1 transcriptional regulator [Bacillus toyonensis]